MRISLRVRVLLIVSAINLVVYGAVFTLASRELETRLRAEYSRSLAEYSGVLFERLQSTVGPQGEINVATILRWPTWTYLDDALIVHRNLATDERGQIHPRGAWLNPRGRLGRSPRLDEQKILQDVAQAIRTGEASPSSGGTVIPILDPRGGVWGGCWFALAPFQSPVSPLSLLAPGFLVSTLLLTLATFWFLRGSVLDPVQRLSAASRRLAAGDLSARTGIARSSGELGELARTFDEMAAKVEGYNAELAREVAEAAEKVRRAEAAVMTQRRLAATGELAAGIAHEINNPLGGLMNAVDALERPDLPIHKREQYVQLLRSGLERIRRTVGQLLRFTPRAARPVPVQLLEPVRDAIALVQHRADAQSVEIALRAADGRSGEDALATLAALPPVLGEAHELGQAVLNLLLNALDAIDALHRPGRIDVTLSHAGGQVVLVVEDDGPGVPAAELPRLVDLFYTTKEAGKGTGLGLSIVHRVVHQHRGAVHLSSAPGRGLRVEITLPAWDAAGEAQP